MYAINALGISHKAVNKNGNQQTEYAHLNLKKGKIKQFLAAARS